jgi:hypothetical protein
MSYEKIKINILGNLIDIKDFLLIDNRLTSDAILEVLYKLYDYVPRSEDRRVYPLLCSILTNNVILTLKAKISEYNQFMQTSLIKELFNHTRRCLHNKTNIKENFFNKIFANGILEVYDKSGTIERKFTFYDDFYGKYMNEDFYQGLGEYNKEIELLNNFLKPLAVINEDLFNKEFLKRFDHIKAELFITIKDDFRISPCYPLTESRIVKFLGFQTPYEKCFIYDPITKTLTVKCIIISQQPVYLHEWELINQKIDI